MTVLTDPQIERALDFLFDGTQQVYAAERTVWGRPIVLRVLRAPEIVVANEIAEQFRSFGAQAMERSVQTLAYAIASIAGKPWTPEAAGQALGNPDDPLDDRPKTALDWRVAQLHEWPALLVSDCYDAWTDVGKEYGRLMKGEPLGELSGAAGSTGA